VAEFGGDSVDPEIRSRVEELLERALATTVIDWQALRQQAERAEERRLPPAYFERFFLDALAFARRQRRKAARPWHSRVTRSPDALCSGQQSLGAFRRIPTEYSRLTFDKSVVTRPRKTDEADLPCRTLRPWSPAVRRACRLRSGAHRRRP